MKDLFTSTLTEALNLAPLQVLGRLVTAFLLGGVVAWIYSRTSKAGDFVSSLPTTLVLLPILIAMVTQVIGDSVARAFSLVGALSIVRFRTVVRDTRDTAFVIFAVVVGMAIGASRPWVAILGIGVTGAAAFIMASRTKNLNDGDFPMLLRVRVSPELDLNPILDRHLPSACRRRFVSALTSKQGGGLDFTYEILASENCEPYELVRVLSQMEGVKDVRLLQNGYDQG